MKIDFYTIIFLVILTETITELLVKSDIFNPVKKFFYTRSKVRVCKFIHDLLDCGYCTSVWAAYGLCLALVEWPVTKVGWAFCILFPLMIHRLSNLQHFIMDRINKNHMN